MKKKTLKPLNERNQENEMFKTHKYALYLVCATHRFLGFFLK